MTKIYKSKIGLELVVPLVLIFGFAFTVIVVNDLNWIALLIIATLAIFIIHC